MQAFDGANISIFVPSIEELQEGEALLYKIRRATSAPTDIDGGVIRPRSREPVHPGVRHRVEASWVAYLASHVQRFRVEDVHRLSLYVYASCYDLIGEVVVVPSLSAVPRKLPAKGA